MSLLTLQNISPTQRDKAARAFDFILFNTTIVPLVRAINVSFFVNLFNLIMLPIYSHQVYPRFVTETDTYTLLYNLSGKKIHLTETIAVSCIIII